VRNDLLARISTCRIYDSFMRFLTRHLGLHGIVIVGVGDSSSPAVTSVTGNLRCMQPHSMLDLADKTVDNWPNRWRKRNGRLRCHDLLGCLHLSGSGAENSTCMRSVMSEEDTLVGQACKRSTDNIEVVMHIAPRDRIAWKHVLRPRVHWARRPR
jgi:hypothetical protein